MKLSMIKFSDLIEAEEHKTVIINGKKARCSLCWRKAKYNVEGVGPLCKKCWVDITMLKLLGA